MRDTHMQKEKRIRRMLKFFSIFKLLGDIFCLCPSWTFRLSQVSERLGSLGRFLNSVLRHSKILTRYRKSIHQSQLHRLATKPILCDHKPHMTAVSSIQPFQIRTTPNQKPMMRSVRKIKVPSTIVILKGLPPKWICTRPESTCIRFFTPQSVGKILL